MNAKQIIYMMIVLAVLATLVACGGPTGGQNNNNDLIKAVHPILVNPTSIALATAIAQPTPKVVLGDPCTLSFVTCASPTATNP